MYKLKENNIKTFDIASYLNTNTVFGRDFNIYLPSRINELVDNSIIFLNDVTLDTLIKIKKKVIILTNPFDIKNIDKEKIIPDLIFTDNSERDFYLIIKEFFIVDDIFLVDKSVEIDKSVILGINVNIGSGSKIGNNVRIGNNTYIGKDVIINDNVYIGSGCYLKDSSIIGSNPFNFIKDDSRYSYMPYFGTLIINDDVWIGSKVVIEKPSLGKSYIENDVKIDDLVQIGSDSNIGKHTQIAAGTIVGRDVLIGSNCLLGINTVIKPKVSIENNVNTGIGAVVVSDLKSNTTYVGNPAKILKSKMR